MFGFGKSANVFIALKMAWVLQGEKDVPGDRISTPWTISRIVSFGKVNTLHSIAVHLSSNNERVKKDILKALGGSDPGTVWCADSLSLFCLFKLAKI